MLEKKIKKALPLFIMFEIINTLKKNNTEKKDEIIKFSLIWFWNKINEVNNNNGKKYNILFTKYIFFLKNNMQVAIYFLYLIYFVWYFKIYIYSQL